MPTLLPVYGSRASRAKVIDSFSLGGENFELVQSVIRLAPVNPVQSRRGWPFVLATEPATAL